MATVSVTRRFESPGPEQRRKQANTIRCFAELVPYHTLDRWNYVDQSQSDLSCQFCRYSVVGEELDDFIGAVIHGPGRSHMFALVSL